MDVASTIGEDLDSFTLLIKNFPKDQNATEQSLEEFLKRLTWQENVDVKPAGLDSKFALFTNVPTDAQEVMEQLKQEAFCGILLDVCEVKQMKKLYVSNLRPDVTEFEICLYLEQSLFKPPSVEEFEVKVIFLDAKRRFAIVRIPDEADMDLYIKTQHTDILGVGLKVSEYQKLEKGGDKHGPKGWQGPQNMQGQYQPVHSPQSGDDKQKYKQANGKSWCPPVLMGLPYVQWLEIDEVHKEKRHLMKKHITELRKFMAPGGRLWIDERKHRIGVGHRDNMKLQGLVSAIQIKLREMTSCILNIPRELSQRLNSDKGFSFLISFFERRQLKAIYYFKNNQGMVIGENSNVAQWAANALQDEIGSITVQVNWDKLKIPVEYFMSSRWINFRDTLMKDNLIIVMVNEDSNQKFPYRRVIVVKGYPSDLQVVREKIKNELESVQEKDKVSLVNSNQGKNLIKSQGNNDAMPMLMNLRAVAPDMNLKQVEKQNPKEKRTDEKRMYAKRTDEKRTDEKRTDEKRTDEKRTDEKTMVEKRSDEKVMQVEMSPLAYKFFKLHLSNFVIEKKTKYYLWQELLEVTGVESEVILKVGVMKNILANLTSIRMAIKIAGISEGYFIEKDSDLKAEINKLEMKNLFAIDIKTVVTNGEKNTMLTCMYQKNNTTTENLPEMIRELLIKLSMKKFLDMSNLMKAGGGSGDMPEELIKEVEKIRHGHVNLLIDHSLKKIVLQGREKFFMAVEKQIEDTVSKFISKHDLPKVSTNQTKVNLNSWMRMDNLPEFLKLIGHDDIFAPDHWTTLRGNLRGVSDNTGKSVRLNPGSEVYKYVLNMVNSTWNSGSVGIGRDAKCLSHSNLKVVNIYSVENVFQYKRYVARLKEFCLQNSSPGFLSLYDGNSASIATRAISSDCAELFWEINECHLFHGTHTNKMQAIIDQGFDFRLGSQFGLFGQGIYFAENSTKADQYADPKESRSITGKNLYMFVARVLLGRMFHATQETAFKRPPCVVPSCCSDLCSQHQLHDSVLGTHKATFEQTLNNPIGSRIGHGDRLQFDGRGGVVRPLMFREFIVYDQAQCFPEFLVEYERV